MSALDDFQAHAVRAFPRECCGLFVQTADGEIYMPFENRATDAHAHFEMPPDAFAIAEEQGMVSAIGHSHPDAPAAPSEVDRVCCEATALPWVIVSVP